MEEPDDIMMSVEDEWFEAMAAEEWDNMDIDDFDTSETVTCNSTGSSNSSGAKMKELKVEEKDARLVPRYNLTNMLSCNIIASCRVIKKPKKVRFHY